MTVDAALLEADAEARAEALDARRSFIVQAPAGSGKTELLIQRYLTLLATVEHPEEVLAITFTRKAAAEMEIRVIEALHRAARGESPEAEHERITAEAALRVLNRDRELDWQVIDNAARLRIQTLDSLNASIARNQPLTATQGATGNAIVADAEMQSLYREAAAATFELLTEDGSIRRAAEDVLEHLDNNTGLYVAHLSRMLAIRDQWLPLVGSGRLDADEAQSLRLEFESTLADAVGGHLALLHADMQATDVRELMSLADYAARNLHDAGDSGHPLAALRGKSDLPGTDSGSLEVWLGLAELLLTKEGGWRRTVNVRLGFPRGDDGEKARLQDWLGGMAGRDAVRQRLHEARGLPPVRYDDDQWRTLLALFRLLPLTVAELQRLFAERGISDHIEVALAAAAALGSADDPGDVALLLDYQVRHILVDEMQDTSSAQYRMLEALTAGWERGDGRTLFCVGDPMQSIYRFRNAEVGQFLLARQHGIGDVELTPLVLRRNFRSGERLVDWFNSVFPSVLADTDDPGRGAVAYTPAVPVPRHAGKGECRVHPLLGSGPGEEAAAGLRVIRDTLDRCPDDTMAVLVRSRTHLSALLPRLRRAGIAYRAVEIDRLTDLPEIIDALALTRALAHRGDRIAWLALLRSPWVGLDWTDLHALVFNDTRSTIPELLRDDTRLSALSPRARDAVVTFRDTMAGVARPRRDGSLRDRVERAWLALGGPGILDEAAAAANVYRYFDVVGKIETAGTLPDVAALDAALDAQHVSSDVEARLQVMTMHRAKGLQFDHVLLFGIGRSPRPRTPEVLSWQEMPEEGRASGHLISPVGARAVVEKDPVHTYIGEIAAEKERHELGRLLYVACTRARKTLHLVGHARHLKSGIAPEGPSLLNRLWPALADDYERAAAESPAAPTPEIPAGLSVPVLRRFTAPWQPPMPADFPGAGDAAAEPRAAEPVQFYWVGAAARLAGTLVHRWIQLATEQHIDLSELPFPDLRSAGTRWLREAGVGSDGAAVILDRAEAALREMAGDERGRWLVGGNGYAELPLTGIVDGRIESVVLDRVRIDDDGTHWIVDYKSGSHEGGDLATFLAAEVERYRDQLRRYAGLYREWAETDVRCALYFPLLGAFAEVPLEPPLQP